MAHWNVDQTKYDLDAFPGESPKTFLRRMLADGQPDENWYWAYQHVYLEMCRPKWHVGKETLDCLKGLEIADSAVTFSELLFPWEAFSLVFETGASLLNEPLKSLLICKPGTMAGRILEAALGMGLDINPDGIGMLVNNAWGFSTSVLEPFAIDAVCTTTQKTKVNAVIRLVANALLAAEHVPEEIVPIRLPRSERYQFRGGERARRNSRHFLPTVKKLYEKAVGSGIPTGQEMPYHVRRMHWYVCRDARWYRKEDGAYQLPNGNWVKAAGVPIKFLRMPTEVRRDRKSSDAVLREAGGAAVGAA